MPEGSVISKPDEWSWKIVGSYLGAGEDFPPRSICAIDHAKKNIMVVLVLKKDCGVNVGK